MKLLGSPNLGEPPYHWRESSSPRALPAMPRPAQRTRLTFWQLGRLSAESHSQSCYGASSLGGGRQWLAVCRGKAVLEPIVLTIGALSTLAGATTTIRLIAAGRDARDPVVCLQNTMYPHRSSHPISSLFHSSSSLRAMRCLGCDLGWWRYTTCRREAHEDLEEVVAAGKVG